MPRLSGVTPSGHIHLGNHLGAVARWAAERAPDDLFFISDMHAMTVSYRPSTLRTLTRESFAVLVAAGIDTDSVFVQSDLAGELGALNWVLECTCSYGEAARMIQFKEKAGEQQSVRLGLLTYPALMAADILLQGATEVPVGSDQDQHVELARTLARRFNSEYGEVFAVPRATVAPTAARILDLSDPTRKMAKSAGSSVGVVQVLDEPDLVRRKVRRAVTDDLGTVRYAPDDQPGVSNLLEILGACRATTPYGLAAEYSSYGALKEATAEAVIEHLRPVRERTKELLADPDELDRSRARGATRAADRAQPRLSAALRLAGLR
ncbi:tryptophan--tRNA ligase [Allosaccharopolyspora coralli]|uniref:Tryptophan--tRNA ligase n=1 Tax=Allosaccharopolyspora coralli TaxID=2665642 RepID=A0A5Q3Q6R1_9PSEU|nr:tryptophan--tRNA ligase [Allosaccharopolyspora coralli]QGK68854.1 tryptophan--tRNA ligase [Allosaccharopolyspora coralli]